MFIPLLPCTGQCSHQLVQTAQVPPDGPTVSCVETEGPDRGLDANQRIPKLLATVKSELIDEMQTAEFETFLGQYHNVFSLEDGERGETDLMAVRPSPPYALRAFLMLVISIRIIRSTTSDAERKKGEKRAGMSIL